jgi:hypothetical protein
MGGVGEAHASEENDTIEVLSSPTFYFANFRWRQRDLLERQLGFGVE